MSFQELNEKLVEVLGPHVPPDPVEIYDAEKKEWRQVALRPVIRSSIYQMVWALNRSEFGLETNLSKEQKEYGLHSLFSIDSRPDYGDIVFYPEGGFVLTEEPNTVIHAFVHANLTGKFGIAKKAAEAEVMFYKTGDKAYYKKSGEVSSSYHEFDETVAKAMESIFWDAAGDEENLNRTLKNWRRIIAHTYHGDERLERAILLYHFYKQVGLPYFLKKVEKLMENEEMVSLPFLQQI